MEPFYCHVIAPIWTVRHPDMAAGWLTEQVRRHGHEVWLLDLNAELYRRETRPPVKDCWERPLAGLHPAALQHALLEEHEPYIRGRLQEVIDRGCRVFGFLLLQANARCAALLSRMIRQMAPDAHIVAGGIGATSLYRYRRRYGQHPPLPHPVDLHLAEGHGFDTWVLGEGEQTLMELLTRLRAGRDLHGVLGLVPSAGGPFAPFEERALIKNLDTLHHATFEGFDLGLYRGQALPFQLSRGCAFARCSHCGLKGHVRGFRVRSPEHAVAELKHHIERYGVREFHFTDLGINGDPGRLEAFCDQVIRSRLDIRWQSFVQIRADMTPALMERMVQSGCMSLNYGLESGSDAVLRRMRKPYTAGDAARVLRMTREAGGSAIINILCGHPGETEEELQRTLEFLSANAESISMVASVGFTGIHPHSPLLDEHEAFDIELDEHGGWTSTDGTLNRERRNERVHRVTEHLRLLGIPCFEAFWEPPPPAEAPGVPSLQEEGGQQGRLRITSLQVVTPGGHAVEGAVDASLPLLVRVGYRAGLDLARAVFDLQIRDLRGREVLVTPRPTERLREVALVQEGWVQLALAGNDLSPGCYLVSAQARLPGSEKILDLHINRELLELSGAPLSRILTMTPHTWTHHCGPLPPGSGSPIRQVRLTDEQGQESWACVSGDPLGIAVMLGESDLVAPRLKIRILTTRGDLVLQGEAPQPLDLVAPEACRFTLQDLPLAPGSYTLELGLLADEKSRFRLPLHLQVTEPGLFQDVHLVDLVPRARWETSPEAPPCTRQSPTLVSARLLRSADVREPCCPGEELVVQMVIAGLPPGLSLVRCQGWITDGEQRRVGAAAAAALVTSPSGAVALSLELQLNLTQGSYELHAAQWDAPNDRPIEPVWTFPLVVLRQSPREGCGLVHAPHELAFG